MNSNNPCALFSIQPPYCLTCDIIHPYSSFTVIFILFYFFVVEKKNKNKNKICQLMDLPKNC